MIKAPLTDSQPHLGTLQLPYGHPSQDTKADIPTLMESYVEFPPGARLSQWLQLWAD